MTHLAAFCVLVHSRAFGFRKFELGHLLKLFEDVDGQEGKKSVEQREDAVKDFGVKVGISFRFWSRRRRRWCY